MSIASNIKVFQNELDPIGVKLIAISKTKSNPENTMKAYQAGQRAFGENQVQELVAKHEQLPQDIEWHLVGHLQTNKVKYIARFVSMIHSVDSLRLLKEINKQGEKLDRQIDCLIQVYIADEDTKFGLDHAEFIEWYCEAKTSRAFSTFAFAGSWELPRTRTIKKWSKKNFTN